jgi:surface polysaccharide O-acyltransferase-like enzyme
MLAKRIDALDAARGAGMLFVCLSHFAATYLQPWSESAVSPTLRSYGQLAITASMIASPSFVCISAFVVGYVYRVYAASMPALRRKLIDRGLFVLVVGHVLQAIPVYAVNHAAVPAFGFAFITDVIAVAIMVGPTIVMLTDGMTRAFGGAVLLLVSWLAFVFWAPHGAASHFVATYAFGLPAVGGPSGFALVPWIGVYFIGTALGEHVGACDVTSARARGTYLLFRIGVLALASGVLIRAGAHGIRAFLPTFIVGHEKILNFLTVDQKFPPGPAYLLIFGGLAILLTAAVRWLAHRNTPSRVVPWLATLGRASFFVFILQRYTYYLILPALRLPYPVLWPLYYASTIIVFFVAAAAWNVREGNRYLTVGLPRITLRARDLRTRARAA